MVLVVFISSSILLHPINDISRAWFYIDIYNSTLLSFQLEMKYQLAGREQFNFNFTIFFRKERQFLHYYYYFFFVILCFIQVNIQNKLFCFSFFYIIVIFVALFCFTRRRHLFYTGSIKFQTSRLRSSFFCYCGLVFDINIYEFVFVVVFRGGAIEEKRHRPNSSVQLFDFIQQ